MLVAAALAITIGVGSFPADAQQPVKVARVGVLLPGSPPEFESRLQAFRQGLSAGSPEDIEPAVSRATTSRADALFVVGDPMFFQNRSRLADAALTKRLPTMLGWRVSADAGGLMSYGPNLPDMFCRAATYVDKILKGAKPVDLPIEQPTKFELVIDLKAAKALGLTIPRSLLLRADELIH